MSSVICKFGKNCSRRNCKFRHTEPRYIDQQGSNSYNNTKSYNSYGSNQYKSRKLISDPQRFFKDAEDCQCCKGYSLGCETCKQRGICKCFDDADIPDELYQKSTRHYSNNNNNNYNYKAQQKTMPQAQPPPIQLVAWETRTKCACCSNSIYNCQNPLCLQLPCCKCSTFGPDFQNCACCSGFIYNCATCVGAPYCRCYYQYCNNFMMQQSYNYQPPQQQSPQRKYNSYNKSNKRGNNVALSSSIDGTEYYDICKNCKCCSGFVYNCADAMCQSLGACACTYEHDQTIFSGGNTMASSNSNTNTNRSYSNAADDEYDRVQQGFENMLLDEKKNEWYPTSAECTCCKGFIYGCSGTSCKSVCFCANKA